MRASNVSLDSDCFQALPSCAPARNARSGRSGIRPPIVGRPLLDLGQPTLVAAKHVHLQPERDGRAPALGPLPEAERIRDQLLCLDEPALEQACCARISATNQSCEGWCSPGRDPRHLLEIGLGPLHVAELEQGLGPMLVSLNRTFQVTSRGRDVDEPVASSTWSRVSSGE